MNSCNFIGRVGKDAVTRYTTGGKAVTGWSIAVDTGWGDRKQTVWIDCRLWGDRGEKLATHIHKGDRIGVVGELGTREHEGKTYITLDVRDVTLLGAKREGEQQRQESAQRSSGGSVSDPDDSIPFAPPITRRNFAALS
jgi:single-strand DNA-binding protein